MPDRACLWLLQTLSACLRLWQVGGLTAGRILIAQGAIDAAKQGVTIAIRYACMRPQFDNKLIMDYLTHQRRLIPSLATTYAMHIALLRLKVLLSRHCV